MSKVVVIAGGTGLIGTALADLLLRNGYQVRILTRRAGQFDNTDNLRYYAWDWQRKRLDERVFEGVSALVHLAGSNIETHRWTENYKAQIAGSRILSLRFLRNYLSNKGIILDQFAGASAIGFYGCVTDDRPRTENDEPGNDFLASITAEWESVSQSMSEVARKVSILRTGVVLDSSGGAFPRMIKPVRLGLASPVGSGRQWLDWIHITDIARIYLFVLQNGQEGIYNAVAPHPVTNREFVQTAARLLNRPCCLPAVPGFLLRLMLGESVCLVLEGVPVSPAKIQRAGFDFRFASLTEALRALLEKK